MLPAEDDTGVGDAVDPAGSITLLYQQWRQGEQTSLGALIERFRPRLLALAHSTLGGRVPRLADAEDALQSAMISFWEQVEQGRFDEQLDRNDLWNLLGLITVRKAIKLNVRARAQKRGGGQVVTGLPLDEMAAGGAAASPEILCTEMLELLDPDVRAFALLRLMGHRNREIADELQCTERKVERKLQLVRAIWEEEMRRWRE